MKRRTRSIILAPLLVLVSWPPDLFVKLEGPRAYLDAWQQPEALQLESAEISSGAARQVESAEIRGGVVSGGDTHLMKRRTRSIILAPLLVLVSWPPDLFVNLGGPRAYLVAWQQPEALCEEAATWTRVRGDATRVVPRR